MMSLWHKDIGVHNIDNSVAFDKLQKFRLASRSFGLSGTYKTGSRAESGGWSQQNAQAWLQGPAACPYVMGEVTCR